MLMKSNAMLMLRNADAKVQYSALESIQSFLRRLEHGVKLVPRAAAVYAQQLKIQTVIFTLTTLTLP